MRCNGNHLYDVIYKNEVYDRITYTDFYTARSIDYKVLKHLEEKDKSDDINEISTSIFLS